MQRNKTHLFVVYIIMLVILIVLAISFKNVYKAMYKNIDKKDAEIALLQNNHSILMKRLNIQIDKKDAEIALLQNNYSILMKRLNIQEGKHHFFDIHKFLSYKSLPIENLDRLSVIPDKIRLLGEKEMKKHKVVFTGISRDNASHLAEVIRHIEYMGQNFADYKVVIFENDSSDATKFMLKLWSMINPKVKILSKDFYNIKRPSIKFMADIRNKYVLEIRKPEYENYDIIIPIDMDMVYGVDMRGLQDTFSKITEWDVVCSNGISNERGNMYDAFAYRDDNFPYGPIEYRDKIGKDYWANLDGIQVIHLPNDPLVPVHSCFGGMAVYKKPFFNDCLYDSIEEDCEHVYLHKCMRSKHNARIFLNPSQIIRYQQFQ